MAQGVDVGGVDGMVGPNTQAVIDSWVEAGETAPWGEASPEYTQAMAGLRQLREHFLSSSQRGIELLNAGAAGSASRAVADWTYDDDDLHLIGIRRNENEVFTAEDGGRPRRMNEDLFILLANGKRLVFRGSTNPNPRSRGGPTSRSSCAASTSSISPGTSCRRSSPTRAPPGSIAPSSPAAKAP